MKRLSSFKGSVLATLASLMFGMTLLVGGASPVLASGPYLYNNYGNVAILENAPGGYAISYPATPSAVTMYCWTDSIWFSGNYFTNRWFYVHSSYTNQNGWVSASWVANQVVVRHC